MISDAAIIDSAPDFISIGSMLKATPQSDGGRRYIYMEASNEGLDQTQEVVLAKALADQADYYKQYGNLDIDHYTVIGAKHGIPDYLTYEVGVPREVRQRDGRTFVKCELYQESGAIGGKAATTAMVERANQVWDSLYKLKPAQRWYPSVGGAVLSKSLSADPRTGQKRMLITKVRWTNIGISKTPVNQHIPGLSTVPMEVFAKSLLAGGDIDWTMAKALEAGYGTDSEDLEGGAALRKESLDGSHPSGRDGMNYWQFRERLAGAIRSGGAGFEPNATSLVAHAMRDYDMSQDEATEMVERFLGDLKNGLSRRKG